MAISRREIIKLGVSYGSGAINFGNDSIAYERALRKIGQDTHLAEFLEELDRVTAVLAAEEAAAEAEAAAAAEAEADDEPVAEDAGKPAGNDAAVEAEATETADAEPAEPAAETAPEEPHENPLAGAIEKAFAFRSYCGGLALGELFVQTTAIINTMREECLPAVDDIDKLKHDYNAIVDYLAHC